MNRVINALQLTSIPIMSIAVSDIMASRPGGQENSSQYNGPGRRAARIKINTKGIPVPIAMMTNNGIM